MLPPRPLYPINESPSPRTSSFSSFDDMEARTEALAALRPMSPGPPGPPSPPSPSGFLVIAPPSPTSPDSPTTPANSSEPTCTPDSSVHNHLQPPEASAVSVATSAERTPSSSSPTTGFVRALDPRKSPLTISRLFSGSRLKRRSKSPTPVSPSASPSVGASISTSASARASTTAFNSASTLPSLQLSDIVSDPTAVEEQASSPSSPVSPTSATPSGLQLLSPKPTTFQGVPLTPATARAKAKRHSLDAAPLRPSSQGGDREPSRPLTVHAFSPSASPSLRANKSAPPSPTRPRASVELPHRAASPTPDARPSSPLRLGRGFNIFSSMFESRNATQLPAIPSRPSSAATMDEFVSAMPIQHAIRNSGTFGVADDGSEIFSLVGFEHLQRRRTSSGSIIEVTHVRRSLYAENPDPEEQVEILAGADDETRQVQSQATRSGPSPSHTFGWRSPALVTPDSERGQAERGLGHHAQADAGLPPHANGYPNGHTNGHAEPNGEANGTTFAGHGQWPTILSPSGALRTAASIMATHAEALDATAGASAPTEESLRRMAVESAQFGLVLEAMATSIDLEREFERASRSVQHDTDATSDDALSASGNWNSPRTQWSSLSAATVRANCEGQAELPSPTTSLPPPPPLLPTELRSWVELRNAQGAWTSAANELRTILATRPHAGAAQLVPQPNAVAEAVVPPHQLPLQPLAILSTETTEDVAPPIPPRPSSTTFPPHRFPLTNTPPRRSLSTREPRGGTSAMSSPALMPARRSSVALATVRSGHGGINGDTKYLSRGGSRRHQSYSSSRSGDDYASDPPGARESVGGRVTRSISTRVRRLSRVVRSDGYEEDDERQQGWFRVTWGSSSTGGRVE